MVGVVPRRIHLWLLSVLGVFVIIIITCSEASSMVNSLDKVKVVNGSSNGLSHRRSNGNINTTSNTATALLARLEKTSFKCKGKSKRLCERDSSRYKVEKLKSPNNSSRLLRSTKSKEKVEVVQLQNTMSHSKKKFKIDSKTSNNLRYNNMSNSDYLPVRYGPFGYQNEQSEARSLVTASLFIFFSIIQFKLVSAIFLAFFGPMVLFMLIVQGFLFKATLVLLGLMMTPS